MESHAVLGADASFFLDDLLKEVTIVECLTFFEDYHEMKVTISDMPETENIGSCLSSYFFYHSVPLFDIEGDVVR